MKVVIGPSPYHPEEVIPELRTRFPELSFVHCEDRAQLPAALADAEVYFGWLTRDEFLAAKRLRWVQAASTGVDSFVRIPELRDSDVLLTNVRGVHAVALAEHAFAMIFAFTRGIKAYIEHQQQHLWAVRSLRESLVQLTGQTMGIVGLGTVGHATAERAHAFGMRVIAVDLLPVHKPNYVDRLEGAAGLNALLAESDYVVITVPYTNRTRGMIGTDQLALMKPTAILIGVSRGGIIQEAPLIAALQEGRLAAAALDVFQTEPLPPDSPLWEVDNLIITPHAAGGYQSEAETIRSVFVDNIARYVHGEFPLRNQVDKQLGF